MSRTIRRRNHYDLNWHVYKDFDPSHYLPWTSLSARWTEEGLVKDHCQRRFGHTDVDKARQAALALFHSDNYRSYGMGSIPHSYRHEAEKMLRAASRRYTDKVRQLADLDDIGELMAPSKRILNAASRFYW